MEDKDYKKLYEDMVALAKDGLKDGLYLSRSAKEVTEFLFPQLKETEDEKVRRELTTFLINFNNGLYSRPSENEIDSWIKWIDKKASDIEKQGEQKPIDESELKFKVKKGKWYVCTNTFVSRGKIIAIKGQAYQSQQEDNTITCEDNCLFVDRHDGKASDYFRYWTIQDAKDGDVLAEHETIVLFKKIEGQNIRCYCTYHYLGFNPTFYVGTLQNKNSYCPSTKEQRDLLFQKMHEAGYEWNADKKELKKIEQESTWNEKIKGLNELETYILSLVPDRPLDAIKVDAKNIRYIINKEQKPSWSEEDEYLYNWFVSAIITRYNEGLFTTSEYKQTRLWLKSLKNIAQHHPKWSKEDSERLLRIHQFIWANRKGDTDEIYQQEQDADWLMSIIPQQNQYDKGHEDGYSDTKYNQWKPTDKQMEDFRMLLDYNIGVFDYAKFMSVDSLYEDLKKNLID